jgi:hypothetical protein
VALGPLREKRRLRAAEKTDWDHLPPEKIAAWYQAIEDAYVKKPLHGKKIILQEATVFVRVMDDDDL